MQNIKDFIYWEIINRMKGNNVNVVCAYIMHEGQLLTQTAQRNNIVNTNDSQKVVPGGKVDMGEKQIAAVHREVKEETNLNVDVLKKLGTVRNQRYELHCYLCIPMDISQMKIMEPNKQKSLQLEDLNADINWTPANKIAFNKFLPMLRNYKQYIRG